MLVLMLLLPLLPLLLETSGETAAAGTMGCGNMPCTLSQGGGKATYAHTQREEEEETKKKVEKGSAPNLRPD